MSMRSKDLKQEVKLSSMVCSCEGIRSIVVKAIITQKMGKL